MGTSRLVLRVHAVVVGVLIGLFAALVVIGGTGTNIGAGFALLPLLVLGLPWNLPVLIDPYAYPDAPDVVRYLVNLGPAVLNVGIHAVIVRVRERRR